jgi:hypothetical protein
MYVMMIILKEEINTMNLRMKIIRILLIKMIKILKITHNSTNLIPLLERMMILSKTFNLRILSMNKDLFLEI